MEASTCRTAPQRFAKVPRAEVQLTKHVTANVKRPGPLHLKLLLH